LRAKAIPRPPAASGVTGAPASASVGDGVPVGGFEGRASLGAVGFDGGLTYGSARF
jgi:hypothetical protein